MTETFDITTEEELRDVMRRASERAEQMLGEAHGVTVTVSDRDEELSPEEAGQRLGFSRQHVRRLIDANELPGARQLPNSTHWRIPLTSVLEFEQRRAAADRRAGDLADTLNELGIDE